MYKKISLSGLVFSALLAMNGCGGGGSSTGVDSISSSSIAGVAVDDLILNGVVEAKDTAGNLLAAGRTSITDGSYTLNVTHTGVVLLNATCDDNSTMYNPVTDTNSTCGSDVNLNSITTIGEAGQEVTVNISPLTEIVYQVALTEAGDNVSAITEDDFDTARAEIGIMLSVDPIADDPLAGDYAEIIDVIHTMAETSTDPDLDTVMEVTDALADALSDGIADGEDVIMDFVAEMDEANLTNNLVEDNGTYTPPEDIAQLSDIDAAKALFTELRTQAMSVTDYTNSGTPGFLDTEALSMEEALNGVVLDISFMEMALNTQLDFENILRDSNRTEGTRPIGLTRTLTLILTGPSSYDYEITEGTATWSGTVSYPFVEESDIYTFDTLSAEVDGTFPLGYEGEVVADGVENSQSFNGSITATKTSSGANFVLNGEVASNSTSLAITDARAELAYVEGTSDVDGNTEPVLNYFKFNGVTLQGIVGGYTIDGSVTVNTYVQNVGLANLGGIDEEYFSSVFVQFNCPTSTLSISNVSFTYDSVTYAPSSSDIYGSTAYFGFYNISGEVQYNEVQPNLTDNASCSSGETPIVNINTWNDSNTQIANSGWLPNNITFSGAISRTGASIEGTLNAKWLNAATMDMESDVETPLVEVTLNGKLQMPERPEMLLSLSFENSETANTLGASYTYGTTVINMTALFDVDMNNGDVEVTTHTGLRADIKITDGNLVTDGTGTVTKDGSLVGTVEERFDVPVVAYIDGSFESLP